jgi:3-oxoadipate enol-lactonase
MPPTLVLLHGLGTGPSGWKPQTEAFDDRGVVVPALPPELDGAARLTTEILEAEGSADVCGLSLGALVALRAAIEHQDGVRRLVLAAGFASLPRRLRALQLGLGGVARVTPRRTLVRSLVGTVPPAHRPGAERELAELTSAQVARLMRAGARFDVADRVTRLDVPTLVLCGENDRHNVPLSRELAHLLPQGELRLVRAAGHVVNLDQPEEFNRLVREFLDA